MSAFADESFFLMLRLMSFYKHCEEFLAVTYFTHAQTSVVTPIQSATE